MMEICSLPLLWLVVLFAVGFDSCRFVFSLSLDDSFLSPSAQRLQKEYSQNIPGIWKLTTNSLPYELDIRSQLDKRFSNDNQNESSECILLRLNEDGTFKQCDEGYKEGRWLKGRWKLQLEELSTQEEDDGNGNAAVSDTKEQSTANDKKNSATFSWLLMLAMNRQYFGPSFDVLLEATTKSTTMASRSTENEKSETSNTQKHTVELPTLKHWQGIVRTGKFLRPSPGKHPLDRNIGKTNEILQDAESLGNFSLLQALSTTAIDRTKEVETKANDEQSTWSRDFVSTEDDTFFFPCGSTSSDDGGVLQ